MSSPIQTGAALSTPFWISRPQICGLPGRHRRIGRGGMPSARRPATLFCLKVRAGGKEVALQDGDRDARVTEIVLMSWPEPTDPA